MNRLRGGIPIPSHKRVTRAYDPALRSFVPAMAQPTENANQTINKVAMLLNRAGSSRFNPILSGLGHQVEFMIDDRDLLKNLYLYQERPAFGPDYVAQALSLGDDLYGFGFVHGVHTVAGSVQTGAVQNFLRIVSRAGATERYCWVKSYEQDVVVVNGENALDDALTPIELTVETKDESLAWIGCTIDFMLSWNDEFQTLHNRNADDKENGNFKAYGGAKFVSFFQTDEDEGVGTEVNPVTAVDVATRHLIEVQNTAGLKHITVRFRSKADSIYYVDVPILIRVVAPDEEQCESPLSERCGEALLLQNTPLPEFMPGEVSEPGEQVVEGTPGEPISRKMIFLAINANSVGASPTLMVRRSIMVASNEDVGGVIFEDLDDEEYLPLISPALTPVAGGAYTGPVQMMIALDYANEKTLGVAVYTLWVKDGDHNSEPVTYPGPSIRSVQYMPPGEAGGTDDCFYA